MRKTIIRCPTCGSSLALPQSTGGGTISCTVCRASSAVRLFPALFRARDDSAGQHLMDEGQSSCMNHPQKQAVAVCDACGKYLCALCDVDWNGEHLCTACIQHRKQSDHSGAHQTVYTHYDSVAVGVVFLSVVLLPPSFGLSGLIAPVAIYVAWRYWRVPWRPVPHGKWRMVMAVALANLVFVAWLGIVTYFLVNLF